jgi:hypothetical protein
MGRLVDLRQRRDHFRGVLADGEATWLSFSNLPAARQKPLAEDVFLRIVVGWEFFLSEWFVGAINRDGTKFVRDLERKLEAWLAASVNGSPYAQHRAYFPAPRTGLDRHPSPSQIRGLLDPLDRNVTFHDFEAFERRVQRQLARDYAGRVASVRRAGGHEIIDGAGAIRNVLAHRSRVSVMDMNAQVRAFSTFPELLKPKVSRDGIGAYLRAQIQGGDTRLGMFAREFGRIADQLAS